MPGKYLSRALRLQEMKDTVRQTFRSIMQETLLTISAETLLRRRSFVLVDFSRPIDYSLPDCYS